MSGSNSFPGLPHSGSPKIPHQGSSFIPSTQNTKIFTPTPHPPGIRPSTPSLFKSNSPSTSPNPHSSSKLPLYQFIIESGPKSILKEYFPSVLTSHYGNSLKEADIAQALGMMAATQTQLAISQRASKLQIVSPAGTAISSSSASSTISDGWNWRDFVDVILELYPYHNWTAIIASLDYPEFYLQDIKGVELIVHSFYYATRHIIPPLEFPSFLFIQKVWDNASGQLSFLRYALMASPELSIFSDLIKSSSRRLLGPEDLENTGGASTLSVIAAGTIGSISSTNSVNIQAPTTTRHALLHLFHQPWNVVDLLELIIHLLDAPQCYEDARALLELAAKQAPELLCLGLAQLKVGWTTPVGDLLAKLAGGFLIGQPGASIVLPRLWRISPSVILGVMGEMHRRDPSCISRLLDIAQDLKALSQVLTDARSHTFVIDLAALASRREHLNLDKWLQEVVRDRKEPFLRALVEYVYEHANNVISSASTENGVPRRTPIPPSPEALSLMVKTLAASVPLMSAECIERWNQLTSLLTTGRSIVNQTTSSQLIPVGSNIHMTNMPIHCPTVVCSYFESASFTLDVEAEANACYERIYAQEASVQDVLETMIRLQASARPRDGMVFACMVHNLLDEFRFFSKYPEKELALTGVIFGQLIHTPGLLTGAPLYIGLRMIAEALLCWPSETKLWRFGMTALAQCAPDAAIRWPSFCRILIKGVSGLASFPSVLDRLHQGSLRADQEEDVILASYLEGLPQTSLQTSESILPVESSPVKFISLGEVASQALQLELAQLPVSVASLLSSPATFNGSSPPLHGEERLLFVINNVAAVNVNEKAKELLSLLQSQGQNEIVALAWLARYLVLKRIGMEPNQHPVYLRLALMIEQGRGITFFIHWSLLAAICITRAILASSQIAVESEEDRYTTLVRNLGSWIGLVTLGLQRPLLHSHLPIAELLLEAHDMERLSLMLPFCCRVIEGLSKAAQPRVLMPRNPWLLRILGLMVDLYQLPNLRLNLKFEIELLFNRLELQLYPGPPSPMLVEPAKLLGMPRRSLDIWRESCNLTAPSCSSITSSVIPSLNLPNKMVLTNISPAKGPKCNSMISMDAIILAAAAALGISSAIGRPFLNAVSEALNILQQQEDSLLQLEVAAPGTPGLLGVLLLAWECSLRMTITKSELSRFISIGSNTVAQLGNSVPLSVARSLAAHLAGASLREPIAVALTRLVEEMVTCVEESSGIDVLLTLSSHSQPILTEIIERLAVVGAAFAAHSAALAAVLYPINMPSGVEKSTLSIWDFFRGWNGSQLPESGILIPPLDQSECFRIGRMLGMPHQTCPPSIVSELSTKDLSTESVSSPINITSHYLGEFDQLVEQICDMASRHQQTDFPEKKPASVSDGQSSLRALMKQVLVLALHAPQRDDTCGIFAERLWELLSSGSSAALAASGALILLLDKLCELSSRVSRLVIHWVMDLAKLADPLLPIPIMIALLESGIVSVLAFDRALGLTLGQLPETQKEHALKTALAIVMASCSSYRQIPTEAKLPSFSPWDWEATLRAAAAISPPIWLPTLLENCHDPMDNSAALRIEALLDEWARLIDAVSSSEKTLSSFVHHSITRGYFRELSLFQFFWKTALDWALARGSLGHGRSSRSVVLARWIVYLCRTWHVFPDNIQVSPTINNLKPASSSLLPGNSLLEMNITELIGRIWAVISQNDLEQVTSISFAELLGAMLLEWHAAERVLDPSIVLPFFEIMAQALHILRPVRFPHLSLAWFEVLSHRLFLPRLIMISNNASSLPLSLVLLLDALDFWTTLSGLGLSQFALSFHEALLRLFLVLLHDFPEFLAQHHWRIISAIPLGATQLRNLVLSAFPRHLKLPDPFSATIKLESLIADFGNSGYSFQLGEVSPPQLAALLQTECGVPSRRHAKGIIDEALDHQPLRPLTIGLLQSPYPRPVWINWVVFYLIAHGHDLDNEVSKSNSIIIENSRAAVLLSSLLSDCDAETLYLLLNGIVNQLRYPNPHTLFSFLLIRHWFILGSVPLIREIIARVLIERLVVQRPHPWGLLVTFVELVRSPSCRFWQQPFTRSSPDVERLFENVARSCSAQEGGDLTTLA